MTSTAHATRQGAPHDRAYTITAGDPGDPLLLLLHGAGASAEIWDEHMTLLSEDYRVIAVDLPGHRNHPADTFTYERASATIREVLADEGQSAVLVGHSVGGYVAHNFVGEHPEVIDAVLTSGSYMNWRHGKGLLFSVLYGYVFAPILKMGKYSDVWRDTVVDRITLSESDSDTVSENPLTGGATAMQATAFADVRSGLHQFDGPVLIGAGKEEPLAGSYGPALADRFGVKFEYLPFDGHNGPVTHPGEFVSVITQFVSENGLATADKDALT